MTTVLIADDDPAFRETMTTLLEASGYIVVAVGSVAEALGRFSRVHPDALIVDLHMPGEGMRLVESVAASTSVPVIVLSADDQEAVKVAALDAGAEDYVTKPFSASELLARLRVVLRRGGVEAVIEAGSLQLSTPSHTVSRYDQTVALTPTEFDLLRALAAAPGFVATSHLLSEVWGPAYHHEHEYVRVYVRRLRAKLSRLGLSDAIESRPGLGYRLRPAP